jgi:nitroreductase
VKVTEAVQHRATIRGFLQDPVSDETIQRLLEVSARAPSGGNVQPWRIYVINGQSMYPEGLHEPYRTNRYALGEAMYEKMGVGREDKAARYAHLARNFDFFDAPAAFFCFVDRKMGSAQWSDLGMFLQTFMLLAVEAGLDTCPQEAWANHWKAVQNFVQAPDNEMLFCGMAIGKRDETKKVNTLRSERMPFGDWGKFV